MLKSTFTKPFFYVNPIYWIHNCDVIPILSISYDDFLKISAESSNKFIMGTVKKVQHRLRFLLNYALLFKIEINI